MTTYHSRNSARRWRFADVEFDERTLTLLVGGTRVHLHRKALIVLLHLLQHAGEVVSKDELAEACWPGRILSDTVLSTTVNRLRVAIRDGQQAVIRTARGFGYQLVAPVTVEWSDAPPPARLELLAGDHPPLRPMWALVERLGSGGSADVWSARHEKSGEQRVFKFAIDGSALRALKREITLYRMLREALGERAGIVRIFDWNLEQAPFYIESEYQACGSLVQWTAAQGGIQAIPLNTRLELIASCAETLAAAHSLGVLHKDIKPSNVFVVEAGDGPPAIRLGDFGSGGLTDDGAWQWLNVTRLGFTESAADARASATQLYSPPEALAGQPPTLQGDIYALGVMLYQIVVGDWRRPLAPGWEREVEDETLREDIAAAVDGDPVRRLADAANLAWRLRHLPERRQQRAAQRMRDAERLALQTQLERAELRRRWLTGTAAVLLLGLATTLSFYLQLRSTRSALQVALAQAQDESSHARAVREFVMHLFRDAGEQRAGEPVTVAAALKRGAARLQQGMTDQPQHAVELLAVLGELYLHLHDDVSASASLQRLLDTAPSDTDPAILAKVRADLALARFRMSQVEEAGRLLSEAQSFWNREPLRYREQLLGSRSTEAQIARESGDLLRAEQILRTALADRLAQGERLQRSTAELYASLGALHLRTGQIADGLAATSDALDILKALGQESSSDGLNLLNNLGALAMAAGDYAAAEMHWRRAIELRRALFGPSAALAAALGNYGKLLTRSGKAVEALPHLVEAAELAERYTGRESLLSIATINGQAKALLASGQHAEARALLVPNTATAQRVLGDANLQTVLSQVLLADAELALGDPDKATALLDRAEPQLAGLGAPGNPVAADARRIRTALGHPAPL